MLTGLMNWLKGEDIEQGQPVTIEVAAAALMIEIMMADDEVSADEEAEIKNLIHQTLGLSVSEINELVELAKSHVNDSHDLYQFTNRINEEYSVEQKFELMVSLWKVAYADGNLDRYEDHMIRKINELLYLHHSHFMKAKHEAKEALGL